MKMLATIPLAAALLVSHTSASAATACSVVGVWADSQAYFAINMMSNSFGSADATGVCSSGTVTYTVKTTRLTSTVWDLTMITKAPRCPYNPLRGRFTFTGTGCGKVQGTWSSPGGSLQDVLYNTSPRASHKPPANTLLDTLRR